VAPDATDPERPIAWRAIVEDEPVRSSDGEDVGTVYDVLGSKEDDIFHGVVVHLGRLGRRVLVLADDVGLIAASHVEVALTSAELHALPPHTDELTFHLGVTGRFRKHAGWTSDRDRWPPRWLSRDRRERRAEPQGHNAPHRRPFAQVIDVDSLIAKIEAASADRTT
jgi:hypothetical protein